MLAEVDGSIGWITFNNPSRRNAVSMDMWQAIPEIMDAFERDPAVRVIVLTGAGDKSFVSGADISEFEKNRSSAEGVARYEEIGNRAQSRLVNAQKPTIAMIRGFCMGGGVGVALSCDLRIAAESAQFGIPAAKLGIGYRLDGLTKLVALVGPAFAKEIFYTARQFDAEEARIMGLVNRVVPAAELESSVKSITDMITANAPLTIKAVKFTVGEILKDESKKNLARSAELVEQCFSSRDYTEGRTAFMEKRKPAFTGT